MGVEYNQPAHLLDRYIKGGDINGGRLYMYVGSIAGKCRNNNYNDRMVVTIHFNLILYSYYHNHKGLGMR